MTKCSLYNDQFQASNNKKFNINFNGGNISSDGGLFLMSHLDKKLNFTNELSDIIEPYDSRQKGKITHQVKSLIQQRIYGIIAGHEDLNDHNTLRNDELYQSIIGQEEPLAGASTLCLFENKATRNMCKELTSVFVETFIRSFKTPPKKLVLDFDATDDPIHGEQEGRFFHGYYDNYCFLPLYVFCGQQLLVPYLRPSNIDGAKHAWAILYLLVKRLREQWPDVKIVFRADGGFCRHKMLNWCDRNDVSYIVGISKNNRLTNMSTRIARKAEKIFNRTGKTAKIFCNLHYGAKTWKHPRRVICKSEHNKFGMNQRYVVTNMTEDCRLLYSEVYCARGDMENRIKEQQLDLFADRTSCRDWWANQYRLILASAAYILMERFRALVLKHTNYAKAQCNTIRLKLIKIGAVIRTNTRKVYISLSSACSIKETFMLICKEIYLLQ